MSLAEFELPRGRFVLRRAGAEDLAAMIALLAADRLRSAEDSLAAGERERYLRAFEAIDADPAHLMTVAEGPAGDVVGMAQLTLIPGLSRGAATRMQIESVHVRSDLRGGGLGGAMMRWAVDEARRRGAALVQLTADARRPDAHRFYERLGFAPSHTGFKLTL
jgi:GNAT superfamily N-acetyltransferase